MTQLRAVVGQMGQYPLAQANGGQAREVREVFRMIGGDCYH